MGGIFTREERAVVLFLAASVVVGSLVLAVGRIDPSAGSEGAGGAVGAGRADEETRPLKVNVNTAGPDELELLPGIGPARAAEVVRVRRERGSFGTIEELLDVRGIGPVTLDRLRPFAVVADTSGETATESSVLPEARSDASE